MNRWSTLVGLVSLFSLSMLPSRADQEGLISTPQKVNAESCGSDGVTDCGSGSASSLDRDKELKKWFDNLKDKTFNFGCKRQDSSGAEEEAEPIFKIVSCDEENALWKYKYSGGKGAKKIFKGKGKLAFTRLDAPPHGYDYGMKSGICLRIDSKIKSIEGNFNEKGILDGEAEILYHDTNLAKGYFRKGVINGMVRNYVDEIDPATNRPKNEKALGSVVVFDNGKQVGPVWTFLVNGFSIFDERIEGKPNLIFVPYVASKVEDAKKEENPLQFLDDYGYDENEKAFITIQLNLTGQLPLKENSTENKTELKKVEKPREKVFDEIIFGNIDEDNMIINAVAAHLVDVHFDADQCVMKVEAVAKGNSFDYDVESKTRMSATKAKLTRFFDVVADSKTPLTTRFEPLPAETIDLSSAAKIIDKLKPVDILKKVYSLDCHYDPDKSVQAYISTTPDDNGQFSGNVSIKMFSKVRSEDHYAYRNSTDPELTEFLLYDQLGMYLPGTEETKKVAQIYGEFTKGKLNGIVMVVFVDGSYMEGLVTDNVYHGVVRKFVKTYSKVQKRKRYSSASLEMKTRKDANSLAGSGSGVLTEISSLGMFKNGLQDGPVWKFLSGGSFMFGLVSTTEGKDYDLFTTEKGTYLNADFSTGYVGIFEDGKMISSQQSVVTGQTEIETIRAPVMSEPSGKVFQHCPKPDGSFVEALVPDPLESEWVYVNDSQAYPDIGQGLFAKKDVPAQTVVSFFGGRLMTLIEWESLNLYEPIYWRLIDDDQVVYLPDDIGKDLKMYGASLGHKINHSFSKANCKFIEQFHPRFGIVPTAITTVAIKEHEEILCNYDIKFENGSPWYQELWRVEIDSDNVEGPYGNRGPKKTPGEPITPMLVDAEVYKRFLIYATQDLKLEPIA